MKLHLTSLLRAGLLALTLGGAAHAVDALPLPKLLGANAKVTAPVTLVEAVTNAEDAAITEKVMAALVDKADELGALPTDGPLPYNAAYGVTQAEFEHFLHPRVTLNPTGQSTVTLARGDADGIVNIDGGDGLDGLDGLILDLNRDEFRTPYGVARGTTVDVKDLDELGPRAGRAWIIEEGDVDASTPDTLTRVRLEILQLPGEPRLLLRYRATVIRNGEIQKRADVMALMAVK
ncbi:hypothetical protein [Deinococcus maricopensis]|uniref:Uncharacterized protein n=1 Tax=Deinococcus maricopensis (strain DSM 21211 / LMG 22137 / NRRL B-23946 / LB-34) TaxID=709986 RepID=E8U2X1_DEIML|nr:hypothetical protein [Deinococcus maricopensis]ADV65709.1 hypothetical protein Deima_0045 [Deinococcus maricopensis DSM 21211]